MNYSCSR